MSFRNSCHSLSSPSKSANRPSSLGHLVHQHRPPNPAPTLLHRLRNSHPILCHYPLPPPTSCTQEKPEVSHTTFLLTVSLALCITISAATCNPHHHAQGRLPKGALAFRVSHIFFRLQLERQTHLNVTLVIPITPL